MDGRLRWGNAVLLLLPLVGCPGTSSDSGGGTGGVESESDASTSGEPQTTETETAGSTSSSTTTTTATSSTTEGDASTGDSGSVDTGGDGGESSTTGPTVEASLDTVRQVVEFRCLGAGCHAMVSPNLVNNAGLYMRLLSAVSSACGNIPLVTPGDPERSAFVQIIKGPCGNVARMPFGCISEPEYSCLPPEYIDAIEQWVANGAPE